MSIKYIKRSSRFIVGRGTKSERSFRTFEAACAYRDAMRDMREAGVL